jgi:hypothetical protein
MGVTLPTAMITGQPLSDFLVGATGALLCAWGLYRVFVARETYFVWILPLFLAGVFVSVWAFGGRGSAVAQGALVGLVSGGIILGRRSWQLQQAHRGRLESFARELGLSFSRTDEAYASDASLIVDDIGGCVNVMQGTWHGVRVALFDYQYMDLSDGEAPAMIVLTCAVAILENPCPLMIIRGHRLGEAFKQRLGVKTGLLGDQPFDRQFRVETADLELARAALRPRTREWLLANARNAKVLINGTTVMLCTGHQTMTQLPELLDRIRSFRLIRGPRA